MFRRKPKFLAQFAAGERDEALFAITSTGRGRAACLRGVRGVWELVGEKVKVEDQGVKVKRDVLS